MDFGSFIRLKGLRISLVIVMLILGIGGFQIYQFQRQDFETNAIDKLTGIAKLKLEQLLAWQQIQNTHTSFLATQISGTIDQAGWDAIASDPVITEKLHATMRHTLAFSGSLYSAITDSTGNIILATEPGEHLTAHMRATVQDAVSTTTAGQSNMALCGAHLNEICMITVAPILPDDEAPSRPIGYVVLHSKPGDRISQILTSWPIREQNAEILFVQHRGDTIRFLPDPGLNDVPAIFAGKSKVSRSITMQTIGYHGREVIAFLAPIHATDWSLLIQIDTNEALGPWHFRARLLILLFLSILLLLSAINAALHYYDRKYDLDTQLQAARSLKESEARLLHISNNLPGGFVYQIKTNRAGRARTFTYISDGCERVLGISPEIVIKDASQLYDLVVPDDAATFAELEDHCMRTMRPLHHRLRVRNAKTDETRWMIVTSAPRAIDDDTILWDGVAFDVTEQQRVETAFQTSESRFQLIFREMFSGFALHEIICDNNGTPIDYRFLLVNPAFERITGLKATDVLGRRVREILPAIESFWIETYGRVALSGKPINFERYAPDIGKTFAVSAFSPEQGQFACILQDISEAKQAEHALRESEKRYEQLALQNRTYTWEVDADGLISYVSPIVEAVLGYRPDELVGHIQIHKLSPAEDRESIKQHIARTVATGATFRNLENRVITKSGEIIWVNTSGVPVHDTHGTISGIRGNDTDINARKLDEMAMARMVACVEQAAEGVIMTNSNGIIEFINPAFSTITGYSAAEAIGQKPSLLKSGTHDDSLYDEIWQTLGLGKTWRGRFINKRKDGTLYDQETAISPVRDKSGNVVNYVAVIHDISETLKLQEQLVQSQKMESIGRLAGGIAHDFNNMLMGIMGYTEIAKGKLPPDHPVVEDLDIVLDTATRTASLTRQLLTFARKQHIQPEILNMNDSITPTLKMLKRLIGESITLEWCPSPDLWLVKVDPGQIDQVLANLCVNARDAIGENGEIRIETHNVTIDELYTHSDADTEPGDYVCCTVSDNGAGIPQEIQEHIFDPFFTTKKIGEGTGLGLATVYGIMKQNQGFIRVYSESGYGTTFKLHFPRYLANDIPAKPEDVIQVHSGNGKTILLVEDEVSVREVTAHFLENMEYRVLSAQDPKHALRLIEDFKGNIDILLTDIVMPGMNGHDMADMIKAKQPGIRIIFMSGYASDMFTREHGTDRKTILSKPFTQQQLAARLIEAGASRTS